MSSRKQRKQSKGVVKSMTAESLIADKNLKFIFVGGKGGVGKTTTSAAIAIQLSYDRKVLLLSTDPAHSLSDAFRCSFTGEPTPIEGVPNLEVMEVDPDKALSGELEEWGKDLEAAGFTELLGNVEEFQEWLVSVPGIDEATALAGVVDILEKGTYDVIVFDTAPTGHTLKLLQLPKVLEAGLSKLESWQTKIWGYWSAFKGMTSGQTNYDDIRQRITQRLREYKTSIEKIGIMLKDQRRTTFALVCIAEHLSINESLRLLDELKHFNISVTHIFVNQLVQDALRPQEMDSVDTILSRANLSQAEKKILHHVRWSVQLCNSRRVIQQNYLKKLKESKEVKSIAINVVELPLLPSEVTGASALLHFSQLFMSEGYRCKKPFKLEAWEPSPFFLDMPQTETIVKEEPEKKQKTEEIYFKIGDKARIHGLKSAHFNDLEGKIVALANETGRLSVVLQYQGERKKLLLKKTNLTKIDSE